MTSLCLHRGASVASRDELAAVPTPAPTATWMPIPHSKLLDGVQASLERAGMQIVGEQHGLSHDGQRYFGLIELVNGHNAEDFGVVIGLRNSHDQKFPVCLAVGATVFVCSNLSFSGEVKIARKHTLHVARDLPQLIDRAVGRLGDLRRSQEQRFDLYKHFELTDAGAHDLVVQALDARVVPVTKIPDVLAEWRTPRHPEFQEGKTAWRLFNSFTECLKASNVELLPKRTQALHGLMDGACGLTFSRN